ncbi:hypothetical protein AAKU52_000822 [Pedobacter sp. CG_S7]
MESGVAAKAADNNNAFIALTVLKNINKILVSENVELILVQNVVDYVRFYHSLHNKC